MGFRKLSHLRSCSICPIPLLLSSLLPQAALEAPASFYRTLTSAQPSSNPPEDYHDCLDKFKEIEGLGARLSSVVREIEIIEKKKNALEHQTIPQDSREGAGIEATKLSKNEEEKDAWSSSTQVEISHPWPEWIELVDRLVQGNYFSARRSHEDDDNDDDDDTFNGSVGQNIGNVKILKGLRNACQRFGRQRFDILRSLSRRDIQVVVGYGCPSLDGKVVSSGKRLRAYVHVDEGDVCSTCNLRGSCDRAYIIPRRDDTARTFDVMRILLTYAHYPLIGSAENKLHMKKTVKASVRKLLKQVVELSATSLDPNLPRPVFIGPPPKVNQAQPPARKKVARDDIEMKKGDWLCPRCDFMNFAKNNKCLQCDEIRPKGKLNPGEWECPGCNFVNYRRNLACYKCECNRPKGDYMINSRHGSNDNWYDDARHSQQLSYTEWKWKKPVDMEDSSKSLNDDFEDAELDGVNVASFKFADHSECSDGPFYNGKREGIESTGLDAIRQSSSRYKADGINEDFSDCDYS